MSLHGSDRTYHLFLIRDLQRAQQYYQNRSELDKDYRHSRMADEIAKDIRKLQRQL
jgi:hypothetical protein